MNISIIGASAGVGLAAVRRALQLGYGVKALSRRKLDIDENSNLIKVQGSALDEGIVKDMIEGSDAILVTLGTGMDTKATTLYSDFAHLLLRVHEDQPIQVPIIIVTGFGAGESRPYLKMLMKPFFRFILNKVYRDKTAMEQILSQSSLQWEIVRPGVLNNKPFSGKYRVETKLFFGMNIGGISRDDVADYLVKEAVEQHNIRKYPALSNK